MTHVPLTFVTGAPCVGVARLSLPWGERFDPCRFARPRPLPARDATPQGGKALRKGSAVRPDVVVLDVGPAELVARRAAIEPAIAAAGAAEDVDLVPIALVDEKGPLEGDFVLIDPRRRAPMDRDASDADYTDPQNPHGSIALHVRRFGWSADRAPRPAIARVGDHHEVVVAREDVAVALVAACRGGLAIAAAPYAGRGDFLAGFGRTRPARLPLNGFVRFGQLVPPPVLPAADVAARAAAAFFALVAGREGDRAVALASPAYAYWLAREVDGGPRDDTRDAACGHPFYAFAYANEVDHGPRDDTRAASARHPASAVAYARHVDEGPHDETRRGAAHPDLAGAYDEACKEAAAVRAWREAEAAAPATAAPAPKRAAKPAAKAPRAKPRAWPAHGRPRYLDEPGPDAPPTHAPLDAAVRSDVDAFTGHGLAMLGVAADDAPEAVIAAMQALVAEVQARRRTLAGTPDPVMALGCALGEALHRALGFSWATVKHADGTGGVAVVARDRSIALYPFLLVERLVAPGARENTVALTFEMMASGAAPPGATPGAYLALV